MSQFITNDVIHAALTQIVNEDMAEKQQSWKTKAQELDLENKEFVKIQVVVQSGGARIQELAKRKEAQKKQSNT